MKTKIYSMKAQAIVIIFTLRKESRLVAAGLGRSPVIDNARLPYIWSSTGTSKPFLSFLSSSL